MADLGPAKVEVTWPDGKVETFTGTSLKVNKEVLVHRTEMETLTGQVVGQTRELIQVVHFVELTD